MAIQIRGNQIKNSEITSNKLDLTGTFNFSSGTLQAGTPSADADVATRAFVLDHVQGLTWKESCRVATTAQLAANYANGSSGVGATLTATSNGAIAIDGVTLSVSNRVLVKDGCSDSEGAAANGIYTVTTVGDGSSAYVLTRALDQNQADEFASSAVFMLEGSVNDNSGWTCTNNTAPNIGTTAIAFAQFSGAGSIVAGDGIAKAGNTISVDLSPSGGLEISAAKLKVDASDGISIDADGVKVNLDGSTLSRSAAGIKVANVGIGPAQLAAQAVEASKIASSAVGNGLSGGAGSALVVSPVATGGIQVDANGVAVKKDGSTLSSAAAGLKVSDLGIGAAQLAGQAVTEAKIATSVAGNGISGGNGSPLAVNLDANPGMQVGASGLKLKLDATAAGLESVASGLRLKLDGATLSKSGSGVKVADLGVDSGQIAASAVDENKLAASVAGNGISGGGGSALTISPIATGGIQVAAGGVSIKIATNAGLSTDANGITVTLNANSGLQLAAGGMSINLDGSTLALGAGGIKINELGVNSAQIADNAITTAKTGWRMYREALNGNNSATTFDMARAISANFLDAMTVTRNGVMLKKVASPSSVDEYSVSANGGTGGVCRVTMGSAPALSDELFFVYMA